MNRFVVAASAAMFAIALSGCSGSADEPGSSAPVAEIASAVKSVTIKQSPDKYTWYIKDYVGMNAGSFGYTALAGDRRDAYGAGNIILVFKTEDGSYVGVKDEEALKDYVVTGQDLEPNTELKYTFQTDSNGEEYDNLVDNQTYDEIVLSVAKVGKNAGKTSPLTEIKASDRKTRYVKDYVGRNLASCGYLSLGGTYNDHYGQAFVRFDITADDGSYVEVGEDADLTQYKVISQSVEPNTPIELTYSTDSEGNEYSNLIASQSIQSIALMVTKLE